MHTGTKNLIFGNMSSGPKKLKLNCSAIMMSLLHVEGKGGSLQYGGGCTMFGVVVVVVVAAGGTGELHELDGIMKKEHYVEISRRHLKTSVTKLKLGGNWVFQMDTAKISAKYCKNLAEGNPKHLTHVMQFKGNVTKY